MWADPASVEPDALAQIRNVASLSWTRQVAVMPDVHYGKGATVGSVIAMEQAISPARYLWVRIAYGIAHLGHARSPDGVGAGRRAPVVAARFQRHVESCAARPLSGSPQGYDLGMGPARWLGGTLPDHGVITHEHRADGRVGTCAPQNRARQL